jgi:hypothetical protein
MGVLVKPTKEQILQFYRQALDRCVEGYAKLDEKEWAKKASDAWTAREHLAYLVGTHEEEGLVLTRQAIAGEPPNIPGFQQRSDLQAFRQSIVARLRELPVRELRDRMKTGFGEHIAMLEGVSEADLDRPAASPAWDRPGALRDLFFAAYLFLANQYQEIRRVAKKKLPHWVEASTPDQVRYHMERVFTFMPLIFHSGRAEDMQATYLFTMEGEGGGQWSIRIDQGMAQSLDAVPDDHDVEIRTKPEFWVDLSSGDLNPVWAITTRKVHLGGNTGLAMKLRTLFSSQE